MFYFSEAEQNCGSLRWFHDGCCECVGSSCQARPENQFGIDQSRWELKKKSGKIKVVQVRTERTKKSILTPFRCEECPLLEDEEDISDEEMEQLVSIFKIYILWNSGRSQKSWDWVWEQSCPWWTWNIFFFLQEIQNYLKSLEFDCCHLYRWTWITKSLENPR